MRNPTKTSLPWLSVALALCASPALAQTWTMPEPKTPVTCPADVKTLPLVAPGKLTMSINATLPPKQYIDKTGKIVGLHVDFGNEIARRLCLTPDYQNVQFEVQIPGLQNKRWDMIDTGLYYTPERAKIMQLIPYTVNSLALVAASGNPLHVKAPQDLAGKTVGVEIAGFEEKTLKAMNDAQVKDGSAPMTIRVFNTYGEAFQALRAGQLDAVFAGDAVGSYYEKQGQFTVAVTGLLPGSPSAFATADQKIADAVVGAIKAMVADGTYKAMMDYYGTVPIEAWKDYSGAIKSYYTP